MNLQFPTSTPLVRSTQRHRWKVRGRKALKSILLYAGNPINFIQGQVVLSRMGPLNGSPTMADIMIGYMVIL
jgi:hypothetical protein